MPWIKVSDDFMQHPKVLGLSPRAIALWLEAMCYVGRHLTDGYVAPTVLAVFRYRKAAPELREAGLWEAAPDGQGDVIHDYHHYQPARDEVITDRDKKIAAGRKGAAARWGNGKTHGTCYGTPQCDRNAPDPDPEPIKKERTPQPPSAAPPGDDVATRFDAFWDAYPKHQAKQDAFKAFKALRVDARLLELLLDALERQKRWPTWTKERGQFVPLPATWLRQKRWEDEPPPEVVSIRAGPSYRSHEDWHCEHVPHCANRRDCDKLTLLAAARAAREAS